VQQTPHTPRPRAWEWVGLAAVLALATWLRSRGLDFGLPAVYNPDEIAIVSRTLAFGTGDLNPHNFLYPTFYFYLLFGWLGGYFVMARLAGAVPSLSAFRTEFFLDPTRVYLAGRWLGVTCGVATVAATWWLARRLFGRVAALAAALFLALAPIAIRDAHYVKHDVPVTLAVVLAMIAVTRVWPAPGGGDRAAMRNGGAGVGTTAPLAAAAVAGAACGVAFSTHYYSIFLALPLGAAILLASSREGWRAVVSRAAAAGLASAIVFVALSPFLVVEWQTALRDIAANRQIVVDRAAALGGTAFLPSAGPYLAMLWNEGTGWPVLVLAIAGVAIASRRGWRLSLLLLLFPVAFLLFISNTVAASRYLNPVLPVVAIFAGCAIGAVAGGARDTRRAWPRENGPGGPSARSRAATLDGTRRLMAVGLTVVCGIPGLVQGVRIGWFFSQVDTRTLAQRFIEATVAPGTSVLVQPYSVQLHQSRESLVEALTANVGGPERASTKFALRLGLPDFPSPAYRTIYLGDGGLDADRIYVPSAAVQAPDPLRDLRARGIELLVWKRYDPPEAKARALLAALQAGCARLAIFSPYADGGTTTAGRSEPFLHNTDTPIEKELARPGPIVEVWRLVEGTRR
jgi:hypothetical protein